MYIECMYKEGLKGSKNNPMITIAEVASNNLHATAWEEGHHHH